MLQELSACIAIVIKLRTCQRHSRAGGNDAGTYRADGFPPARERQGGVLLIMATAITFLSFSVVRLIRPPLYQASS